jgi:hypothetical protein
MRISTARAIAADSTEREKEEVGGIVVSSIISAAIRLF